MKRVYLHEAIKARPIITRLTKNLVNDVALAEAAVNNAKGKDPHDPNSTAIQLRQILDEVEVDVDRLRTRLAAAEFDLQPKE